MHLSAILVSALMFCIGWVNCRVNITNVPQAQHNFDINKYLGVWYDQAKVAPCSFAGSNEFTDWKLDFIAEGKRFLLVQEWRNAGVCVNIRSVLTERQSGCYTVKDPIGDVFSGEQKVVATDYKRFSITWGCTRRSLDGQKCRDPWLSVETRQIHPDAYTFKVIDAVLKKLFGFGIDQTLRIHHGNPCH